MHKLQKYIISNLSILFISIFSALFTIASVIFLIKLATFTAVIQLSIWEMTKLYIFVLPEILFYTLPITFFIAATLSIFRLSNDNEIIVLFSLGIHPKFLLRILFKPALFLSILLLVNYLIIVPKARVLSQGFISYKKSEAKFNLSASEFGHKFGKWLLYIGESSNDGTYGNVFLFNKNNKEEILIGAKKAEVINEGGLLRLKLQNGEGYSYSNESFSQINFETMYINDTLKAKSKKFTSPLKYWQSKKRKASRTRMIITNTLISIFPLISLFLVAAIGIVHVRHQKAKIYLYLFLSIVLYYGATLGLQSLLVFYTIPIVAITWLIVTYMIYKKTILARF